MNEPKSQNALNSLNESGSSAPFSAFIVFSVVRLFVRELGRGAALAAIALLMTGTNLAAQSKKSASKVAKAPEPAYDGPSTQQGVYTNEQASRGKTVYLSSCKSCHSPQSHTGATFNKFWRNHPLSDLYGFVATKMPKNDPGSLAPEDVADVVAYLLKMNAMPVGPEELYPDADSLKKFRIETKRSSSTATKATTATRAKP